MQECLKIADDATKEVGQEYTWNDPYQYDKDILLIGTFHLICAFFNVIRKKMNGCGFSDVLIEAELVKSGTVHGVMGGKNYSRTIVCHKTIVRSTGMPTSF